MLRRPRQTQRAPTIMATPAPGGLELWKPPKKLNHRVVLTNQLLTRNQNLLNISADTPLTCFNDETDCLASVNCS